MTHRQSSSSRRKHPRSTSHLSSSVSMDASTSTPGKRIKCYCCRRGATFPSSVIAVCTLLFYITWKWMAISKLPLPYAPPRYYSFDIVNEFPHDPEAFTQGLVYGGNELLFESTGLYHRSSVRQVQLQTGKVQVSHKMDDSMFGEGLTLLGESFWSKVIEELVKFIENSAKQGSDCIARISPENGTVLGWILLRELRHGLLTSGHAGNDVLNGIAWDDENKRLFVTGKLWPKLYHISIHPIDGLKV